MLFISANIIVTQRLQGSVCLCCKENGSNCGIGICVKKKTRRSKGITNSNAKLECTEGKCKSLMIIIMTFTAIFKSNDFSSECECLAKSNRTRNCIVFVVVESNSALWNARGIYTKILNVTLIGFIFQFDSCSTQTNTQS